MTIENGTASRFSLSFLSIEYFKLIRQLPFFSHKIEKFEISLLNFWCYISKIAFFYLHRFFFNMCMCLRVKQHPENYGTKILEMSMIHDVDGGWWWRRWRRRCGGLVAEAQDRFTYLPDVSKVISSHVIRLQIAIVDS